jgi:hypothetical protein
LIGIKATFICSPIIRLIPSRPQTGDDLVRGKPAATIALLAGRVAAMLMNWNKTKEKDRGRE